jgi:hypothetical protein
LVQQFHRIPDAKFRGPGLERPVTRNFVVLDGLGGSQ